MWSWKGDSMSLVATEHVSDSAVITVPADGLAPLGARASAGTVTTKPGSCISPGPAREGY